MCDHVDRQDRILAYLYDEMEPGLRQAFEAHLSTCGACRADMAGLEATREHLGAWGVPDARAASAGLRLVAPAAAPRGRAWASWGLAAAATLVFGLSAALANLEVRVGTDGLVIRTGWAQAGAGGAAQADAGQVSEIDAWQAELARVQARLEELEAGIASRPGDLQAASGPFVSEAELIRRVRDAIAQSEARQQRAITGQVSQIIDAFDRQRRLDLAAIQQGMGQYQGLTNAEIARQSDMLNHLVRVATRQER
jgi:hypothetical protein